MGAVRWATFDCYGTLIDWDSGIAATLAELWPDRDPAPLLERYHGIEPEVQAGSAMPYQEVLAASLGRLAAAEGLALPAGREGALSESLPGWAPFPEVPGALAELRRRGWRLGVLSNTDPDLLAASVERIGVPVDVCITAAEAGSYKPAHGHWERFRERSGAGPDEQVHVAVSMFHDIVPAAELGIPAVWIDRAGDVSNRLGEGAGARRAADLPDLAGLPDTLDRVLPAE